MGVETAVTKMGGSAEIGKALANACTKFGINTKNQQAHFLGQIYVESGGFRTLRESLNYSVDGLLKTFSRNRISQADAQKFGRAPGRPANQSALANILYGGEFGRKNLGNIEPGDGWAFIGRGLKQLTGRFNYDTYSKAMYGDNRIIKNSALLEQLPDAALSAGWFWSSRNLNQYAEANDYQTVTKKVNGGLNGYDERVAATKRAFALL